jgi:hypothetical protein
VNANSATTPDNVRVLRDVLANRTFDVSITEAAAMVVRECG